MSRILTYLTKARTVVPWMALGGLIFFSWALSQLDTLLPALPRVIGLFGSIALLVSLVWWTVKVFNRLMRKVKQSTPFRDWWRMLLGFVGVAFVLFLAFSFVTDWGLSIRSWSVFSFLPSGNLFAAGWISYTYLVLVGAFSAEFAVKKWKTHAHKPVRDRSAHVSDFEPPQRPEEHDTPRYRGVDDIQELFHKSGA